MARTNRNTLAAYYLLIQGTLGAAWWAVVYGAPDIRRHFFAADDIATNATFVADVLLFVGGSFFAGWAILKRQSWMSIAMAVHVGGVWYAGLFAIGQAYQEPVTWPGAAMMLPCMIAVTWILFGIARRASGFQ